MDKLGGDAEALIDQKLALLRKIPDYKDYTVAEMTDLAAEEVVADGMELVLTDGKVLEELAHTDKSLWQKIRDWITDIIGQIRRSYESLNQASKTAQVLAETMESLDEIERLFTEGVREAGERTRTAEGETLTRMNEEKMQDSDKKYSLREEFSHEFDEWMKNTPLKKRQIDGGYFIIGKTSEALKRIGVRESNIYWRKQKVQFIMDEHPEIDGHIIKDIPSIVENPIVVMKSQTHDDSITMFGDVKAGDFYVMVAVNLTPKPSGRTEAEFSLIANACGRSDNNAKSLIEKSEVLYMAKKSRADTLLTSLGVQFPSDQQAYDSTYGSITYSDGKVNIEGKKSLKY